MTMIKTIHKYIAIGSILLSSLLIGCSSFDDINSNPDATTEVNAAMLCTSVVLQATQLAERDARTFIGNNALPKYVAYAIEGQDPSQYNLIGRAKFDGMTMLPTIDKMLDYAKGSEMENSYIGVAKFARAVMFYKYTMEMGDIPYTETNKGNQGVFKVKYDSQESVVLGVLNELKEADQSFAKGIIFSGDPSPFNGDPVKWRKATNAIALKILMSLSKKENINTLNIKARFAEIVSEGNLLDAETDYYGLNYSALNRHPLSWTNDMFTSRTILSSLLVDNLKRLNDRRLFYFAEPSGAQVSAGKSESDFESYVGVDVSMDYATMNAEYVANKFSRLNKRYLTEDACEPLRMITFAEQQLILAEGKIRGWIATGNAQTYYEEGVKAALRNAMDANASYAHSMAIDQTYIDTYFTTDNVFEASADKQLKQIWMQRYILNFMQEAETSYFEYRRNTYPDFPINPATSLNENNKEGIPMRWLYPASEVSYNRDNLTEALNNQYDGYDEINKLMWLLK